MYKFKNKLDRLLFSTIRIETDLATGTGFIAHFGKSDKISKQFFLVTNKHVLSGANFLSLKFHSLSSYNLETKTLDLSQHEEITHHGDIQDITFDHPTNNIDITLIDLTKLLAGSAPLFLPLDLEKHIIDEPDTKHISGIEKVFFSGYPNGLIDTKNLLPIVRTGVTATPYEVDFEGEPIFLIDGSVFPGSSGSPVFLADHNQTLVDTDGKGLKPFSLGTDRFYLLGIISRVYTRNEEFDLKVIDIPTSKREVVAVGNQMIDIGLVYKATEILKLAKFFLMKSILEPAFTLAAKDQASDKPDQEALLQLLKDTTIDNTAQIDLFFNNFLKNN